MSGAYFWYPPLPAPAGGTNATVTGLTTVAAVATFGAPTFVVRDEPVTIAAKAHIRNPGAVVNLAKNPSNESTTPNHLWQDLGTFSVGGPDTFNPRTGTRNFQASITTTDGSAQIIAGTTTQSAGAAPVSAATEYTGSMYVKRSAGSGGNVTVRFRWLDGSGGFLAFSSPSSSVALTGSYQRLSVTATSHASAVYARIEYLTTSLTTENDTTCADDAMITLGSTLHAYFDGTTGAGYQWQGTAHESESEGPPIIIAGSVHTGVTVAAVATVGAPTVIVPSGDATVTGLTTVAAVATVGAPTFVVRDEPVTIAAVTTVGAPTLAAGVLIGATVVSAVSTVGAPTLAAGVLIGATVVSAVATVGAPTFVVRDEPVTIAATATVGTPTLVVIEEAVTVAAVATVGVPTVTTGGVDANVVATTVQATTALHTKVVKMVYNEVATTSTKTAADASYDFSVTVEAGDDAWVILVWQSASVTSQLTTGITLNDGVNAPIVFDNGSGSWVTYDSAQEIQRVEVWMGYAPYGVVTPGTATVTVENTGTDVDTVYAVLSFKMAAGYYPVVNTFSLLSENQSNPQDTVNPGAGGGLCLAMLWTGIASAASLTDVGTFCTRAIGTAWGTGNRLALVQNVWDNASSKLIGWTATSDDVAFIATSITPALYAPVTVTPSTVQARARIPSGGKTTTTVLDPVKPTASTGRFQGWAWDDTGTTGVMVGENGSTIITTSDGGQTFASRTLHASAVLYGVAYGNGYWVASGNNGGTTNTMYYTTTPETVPWTAFDPFSATTGSSPRVAYGNGYWMIVGPNRSAYINGNPTGSWTESTTLFAGGNPGGSSHLVYMNSQFVLATNAATWYTGNNPSTGWATTNTGNSGGSKINYNGTHWVMGASAGKVWYTSTVSGAAWTEITYPSPWETAIVTQGVMWDRGSSRWWVAQNGDGGNGQATAYATTPSGTWTKVIDPWRSTTTNVGTFEYVSQAGFDALGLTDGYVVWNKEERITLSGGTQTPTVPATTIAATTKFSTHYKAVAMPGTTTAQECKYVGGYWIATGNGVGLATTDDIILNAFTENASAETAFGANTISGVDYGNGVWVIVGSSGKIATATDPTGTWTLNGTTGPSNFFDVAYADGVWVAVGGTTPIGMIYTATDPTGTWTSRTPGQINQGFDSVVYDSASDRWLANHANTAGVEYASDPTGTWTNVLVPGAVGNGWGGVATDNAGTLVVVGSDEEYAYSTDGGTSWTLVAMPTALSTCTGVAYGNGQWIFTEVAQASLGYTNDPTTTTFAVVDDYTTSLGAGREIRYSGGYFVQSADDNVVVFTAYRAPLVYVPPSGVPDATVTGLTTVAAVATVGSPTIAAGSLIAAVSVSTVATVGTPTLRVVEEAVTVQATTTVGAPTIAAGSLVAAVSVSTVATVGAPTLAASVLIGATVVSATTTVGAPTLAAGVLIGATAISAVTTVGAPTIQAQADATVTPSTVAGVTTVGAPGIGAVVSPAVLQYVRNANVELGTNANWVGGIYDGTYDGTELYAGHGTIKTVVGGNLSSADLEAVDPTQTFLAKWAYKADSTTGLNYRMLIPIDRDGAAIRPYMVWYLVSTTTTLAADVLNGAGTVTLTDATNWHNGANSAQRNIGFWNYVDGAGYAWPTHTYTRTVIAPAYAQSGISGNVITLSTPYSGPTIPAGTAVSNMQSAGTYKYTVASGNANSTNWREDSLLFTGLDTTGKWVTDKLPYGTVYLQTGILNLSNPTGYAWLGKGEIWLMGTIPVTVTVGSPVIPKYATTVSATTSVGAPTIAAGSLVSPVRVAATATVGAPTIAASVLIAATSVSTVATVGAPTFVLREEAVTVQATATVGTPTLRVVEEAVTVAATATVGAPTIAAGSLIAATVVPATTTVGAPTFAAGALVSPVRVLGTATVGAPTLPRFPATVQATTTVGTPTFIVREEAVTVQATTTVGAPTLAAGVLIGATAVSATTTVGAPTLAAGVLIAPTVVSAVTTVGAPTIPKFVATINATTTVGAPTLAAGVGITAVTVPATTTVGLPTFVVIEAAVTIQATTTVGAPTLAAGVLIGATNVAAVVTVGSPAISAGSDVTVAPGHVSTVVSVGSPTIAAGVLIATTAVQATSTVGTPALVFVEEAVTIQTTATVGAPTLAAGAVISATVVPATATVGAPSFVLVEEAVTVSAVATVGAPTLAAGVLIAAVRVAAVATVGAPTLAAGVLIPATKVSATATVGTPTFAAGVTVAATNVAATTTVGAPTFAAGVLISATSVSTVATVPMPQIVSEGNAVVFPSTIQAPTTVGAPVIAASSLVTPVRVAAVATVAAPTLVVVEAAATISALTTVGTPTFAAGSVVAPVRVLAVSSVGTPTVSVAAAVAAVTVAATATVGSPTVTTVLAPSTIVALTTVGTPTFAAGVTIAATTVSITTTVGTPGIFAGAGAVVSATVISVSVSVGEIVFTSAALVPALTVQATSTIGAPDVFAELNALVTPATITALCTIGPHAPRGSPRRGSPWHSRARNPSHRAHTVVAGTTVSQSGGAAHASRVSALPLQSRLGTGPTHSEVT